jgi:predicted acylesterase/phospholipase RssA
MKKCDLVMKGGITSGIVYPGAVCDLASEYQFANIGGTSAGAIAAALTAAAEYRRQSGGGTSGFDELGALPSWLAGTEGGASRLLRLFQASGETAPLLEIGTAAIRARAAGKSAIFSVLPSIVRRFHRFGSMVAGVAAILAVIHLLAIVLLWDESRGMSVSMSLALFATLGFAAVMFVLASVVEALVHALRVLPANAFGVCSGMPAGDSDTPALTEWLADTIDAFAGRGPSASAPLTFGDLWSVAGGNAKNRTINLEMMTTNLTHGRPYRLPGRTRRFFFAPDDMRRLFPERIVRWMIATSATTTGHSKRPHVLPSGEELFALPSSADLPVVVAARMSLSFPLLLSAVPLYAVDYGRQDGDRSPERCWFSDGGITSNFPVHFFDAPLPRWPTFAFNLAEKSSRYHRPDQRIHLPNTNAGGILEWWNTIRDVPGFLWSIVTTMQNWRDNMLLRMPGQRDRIAHVLLAEDEGGINLTMEPATIEDMARRGAEAASVLRQRFADAPPAEVKLNWRNHKWVRFRAFMFALEGALASSVRAFDDRTEPPSFRELLDGPQPSYVVRDEILETFRNVATRFVDHAREEFEGAPFRTPRQRPKPEPVLRAMPTE